MQFPLHCERISEFELQGIGRGGEVPFRDSVGRLLSFLNSLDMIREKLLNFNAFPQQQEKISILLIF
jgi:hypothetical protein